MTESEKYRRLKEKKIEKKIYEVQDLACLIQTV